MNVRNVREGRKEGRERKRIEKRQKVRNIERDKIAWDSKGVRVCGEWGRESRYTCRYNACGYCVSPLLLLQYYCCNLVGTLVTVVIS